VAIGIARTLTENGDSGGYRTWRVYFAVLAALLTVASAVAGTEYLGKVIGIADGDTFTLLVGRDQLRIRLAEIDTPEKGQPYGRRARQALSALIYGKTVRVVEIDRDRYRRVVGCVNAGGIDVNAGWFAGAPRGFTESTRKTNPSTSSRTRREPRDAESGRCRKRSENHHGSGERSAANRTSLRRRNPRAT
jgi:endonuclease YncB( thermonuclease family)